MWPPKTCTDRVSPSAGTTQAQSTGSLGSESRSTCSGGADHLIPSLSSLGHEVVGPRAHAEDGLSAVHPDEGDTGDTRCRLTTFPDIARRQGGQVHAGRGVGRHDDIEVHPRAVCPPRARVGEALDDRRIHCEAAESRGAVVKPDAARPLQKPRADREKRAVYTGIARQPVFPERRGTQSQHVAPSWPGIAGRHQGISGRTSPP